MRTVAKVSAILIVGFLALYVLLFLALPPIMANAPSGMTGSVASAIYAALYRPVRDTLASDGSIHRAWRDYEDYWCAGSARCVL